MSYEIGPLTEERLPALARFLATGFGLPPGAEAVATDVLRWKYLDARPGVEGPRSLVAIDGAGEIVGHVGLGLTTWRAAGSAVEVPALHMMDWLRSDAHRGLGGALMERAHARAEVSYVLGGSVDARRALARAGYERRAPVGVFRRILRPAAHVGRAARGGPRALLAAARDAVRAVALDRPAPAGGAIRVRPEPAPGALAEALSARVAGPLAFTGRHAGEVDALLAYPCGGPSAFCVERDGRAVGLGVLNVIGPGRVGKVVELFLDDRDPAPWRDAFGALADELARRGAVAAMACASTPWAAAALGAAGFRHAFDLDLHVRDPARRLPADVPCHLTFFEADYAYLP
jgi:predicted N-acetyltransferase YhbS